MIITKLNFLERTQVETETLSFWIDQEWLSPAITIDETTFSEIDLARAQLIKDLIHDLGVNAEGVGIVLHLVDQLHGLRRLLRHLLAEASPDHANTTGDKRQGE